MKNIKKIYHCKHFRLNLLLTLPDVRDRGVGGGGGKGFSSITFDRDDFKTKFWLTKLKLRTQGGIIKFEI